jgi:twinkle protein
MQNINELKDKIDIVDVIGGYVKLKKSGVNHTGLCPFHNEKSGSFTVNQAKKIYKCFGCGKSGDAISFVMEHENKSFIEALDFLGAKYQIEVKIEKKKEYVKPIGRLEKLGAKALDFFENQRKISNNTLLSFKVTEAMEFMPQVNAEAMSICFNYYRGEVLVNIKFRGPKKSFKLAKDAELILYNLNSIENQTEAVIVEGEIDAMSFHESGVYNVVSVPNGASAGVARLEYLDNCYKELSKLDKIILAVDNDAPGIALKNELARRLGKERCWFVNYPEDCKDANDVLIKYGRLAVHELYQNAEPWPIEGIVTMDDMFDDIDDWYQNGYPKGADCHINGLNEMITFAPKRLTIVTGIPGHGKDEMTNNIMAKLAQFEQWNWAVAGFEEESPVTATKLMEKFMGKSFEFRKNKNDRMSQSDFERGVLLVDEFFSFIDLQVMNATLENILKKAEELVMRKGIKGIIINPWNCLEHFIPPGQNETNYISQQLSILNNFLFKYDLHGILVAHPTKMQKDLKTGKYQVPTLYSINGSANFYNKTHNGLCVYRDFDTNNTTVYLQKIKQHWEGETGWCEFAFNTKTREYSFLSNSKKKDFDPFEPQQNIETQQNIEVIENINDFFNNGNDLAF